MDETQINQINEGREMIADAKAAAAADEHAASDERVATPGFPIRLADGSEVMAVKKIANAHTANLVVDAEGNKYAPQSPGTLVYVLLDNEELADSMLGTSDEDDAA